MTPERAIEILNKLTRGSVATLHSRSGIDALEIAIKALERQRWILFTERKTDDEEKDVYGCDYMLDCKLPDDEQEIIVSYANGSVDTDIFMEYDNKCYLDSGCEFVNEAVAWMPLPEPYKGDEQ